MKLWLVGWFYGISIFVGLFYAKVSLTIMISNYMWSKNVVICYLGLLQVDNFLILAEWVNYFKKIC